MCSLFLRLPVLSSSVMSFCVRDTLLLDLTLVLCSPALSWEGCRFLSVPEKSLLQEKMAFLSNRVGLSEYFSCDDLTKGSSRLGVNRGEYREDNGTDGAPHSLTPGVRADIGVNQPSCGSKMLLLWLVSLGPLSCSTKHKTL